MAKPIIMKKIVYQYENEIKSMCETKWNKMKQKTVCVEMKKMCEEIKYNNEMKYIMRYWKLICNSWIIIQIMS